MRVLTLVVPTLIALGLALPVRAQQPAAAPAAQPKLFASASDVAAMIAKAKAERKPDQANFGQQIVGLAPYSEGLEYRAIVGPAAVHETEAEAFYVIDGGATMVTGGTLKDEKRTNPTNLSGTGIEGGTSRHVAKGDFIIVPEKTAHWFSAIDSGGALVLMTLHLPRH